MPKKPKKLTEAERLMLTRDLAGFRHVDVAEPAAPSRGQMVNPRNLPGYDGTVTLPDGRRISVGFQTAKPSEGDRVPAFVRDNGGLGIGMDTAVRTGTTPATLPSSTADLARTLGDRVPSRVLDGGVNLQAAPKGPPSIDDLIALLPTVNHSDYVAPFDQAESAARAAHDAAIPAINELHAGLVSRLGSIGADQQSQMSAQRAALEQRVGAQNAEMASARTGLVDSLKAQGVDVAQLLGMADAGGLARQEAAQQNGQAQVDLQSRLADVAKQSMDSRLTDAESSKTEAANVANATLQQLLGQIGMRRADSERQYTADTQSRALDVAKLQMQQQGQDTDNYIAAAKADADKATEMHKLATTLATTPRQNLEKQFADFAAEGKYPVARQAFMELVSRIKGKGQLGYSQALDALNAGASGLADGSMYGHKLDVATLKDWLKAYYDDETKSLSPDALDRLKLGTNI